MIRDVVFRPQAEDEALEAQRWYEVNDLVARITENPLAFQRVRGDTRRGVLKTFPYAIYFRETATAVIVLAIHGRQDPSRWQTRS